MHELINLFRGFGDSYVLANQKEKNEEKPYPKITITLIYGINYILKEVMYNQSHI